MMHPAKLTALSFAALVLLTSAGSCVIYKLTPVPGAVAVALSGILTATVLGFVFGRQFGASGVSASAWAGTLLALPLCAFALATPLPGEKFYILSGLGYWAVPFAGLVTSLYGLRTGASRSAGGA